MIAMLAGVVDQATGDGIVLDVNGVGYLVFASSRTLAKVPARGEPLRLLIETQIREDYIHLFGFIEEAEREWFRLLMTVQGVGAKIALGLLSAAAPAQLATAIAAQDRAVLTEAEGVGPKLAQRILNELKDKVGGLSLGPSGTPQKGTTAEAVSALVNLGYARGDAYGAVAAAVRQLGAEAPLDALIVSGLKELAR